MLELIKRGLITWNEQKNQRLKLQQTYVALAIISLTIGGGLILISNSAAHLAASIAGIVGVVFLVNSVAWTVLDAIIAPRLPSRPERAPQNLLAFHTKLLAAARHAISNHETISICQNTQSTL